MPYCPKCGKEVTGEMEFCPKCGVPLKPEKIRGPAREAYEKQEKEEKQEKKEKEEKEEKEEKHEKGETSRFWMLVGGLILTVIGVVSLTTTFLQLEGALRGAFFLVVVGAVLIVLAVYGAVRASGRNPRP